MKIGTFNVHNTYDDKCYPRLEELIDRKDLDFIGLQEVNHDLYKRLVYNYNIYGEFRSFFINKYNEACPIITDHNVNFYNTYQLPVLYSFIPRIATVVETNCYTVINTHLALYKYHFVKKLQFKRLIELIEASDKKVILMGDLNLRKNSEDLKLLDAMLSKYNLVRVKNKENTFKNDILDYIYVPKGTKVNEVKVYRSNLSDHYLLYCDISV